MTSAEVIAGLRRLVGTVCPACRSEIIGHPDLVFCFDPYCCQQKDLYREHAAGLPLVVRTPAEVAGHVASGRSMCLLTGAELTAALDAEPLLDPWVEEAFWAGVLG